MLVWRLWAAMRLQTIGKPGYDSSEWSERSESEKRSCPRQSALNRSLARFVQTTACCQTPRR